MYRQVIGVPQELLKKERKKKRVPQDKRARLPPLRFKKKKKCTSALKTELVRLRTTGIQLQKKKPLPYSWPLVNYEH
jgi:hypothetical protein